MASVDHLLTQRGSGDKRNRRILGRSTPPKETADWLLPTGFHWLSVTPVWRTRGRQLTLLASLLHPTVSRLGETTGPNHPPHTYPHTLSAPWPPLNFKGLRVVCRHQKHTGRACSPLGPARLPLPATSCLIHTAAWFPNANTNRTVARGDTVAQSH